MKKPPWKTLVLLFLVTFFATTVVFAAYHVSRARYPAVKTWLDASSLDSNAITAYFTALAFVGFLLISVYQAYCNAATEHELEEEKKQNRKLQHDSMWLTVQIARLRVFTELKDQVSLDKTIREIESHWARLSQWMSDEKRDGEPNGAANGSQPIRSEANRTLSEAGSRH